VHGGSYSGPPERLCPGAIYVSLAPCVTAADDDSDGDGDGAGVAVDSAVELEGAAGLDGVAAVNGVAAAGAAVPFDEPQATTPSTAALSAAAPKILMLPMMIPLPDRPDS
jgi:hypothetical protein